MSARWNVHLIVETDGYEAEDLQSVMDALRELSKHVRLITPLKVELVDLPIKELPPGPDALR